MNERATLDDVRRERRGLTVDDFDLLHENGAFADYGKTELIDGDIYVMSSQWSRHAKAKSRLFFALASRLAAISSDLEAIVEVTIKVAADSAPEPDIVLTNWQGDRFVPAEAVALVIEVSHSTLDVDLGRKRELYAAAGIPEYWVVNVSADRVLVHTRPTGANYEDRHELPFGEPLASATIAGLIVSTDHLVH